MLTLKELFHEYLISLWKAKNAFGNKENPNVMAQFCLKVILPTDLVERYVRLRMTRIGMDCNLKD